MELKEQNSPLILETSKSKNSKPSETMKNQEKPHISDIFIKTEIHGLPDWYQAKEPTSKTAWTLILIFALSFMIYELIKVSLDFKNNPILTTYSIVSEPRGLRFPEIYICPLIPIHEGERIKQKINENWLRENRIDDYFKPSTSASNFEDEILSKRNTMWSHIQWSISQTMRKSNGRFKGGMMAITDQESYTPKDLQDYFMKVGYAADVLFKECSFDHQMFNCSEIVEPIFDRDHGKCFVVKTSTKRQQLPGVGLSVVLNLDLKNATRGSRNPPPLFDGAYIKIDHDFDPASYRKILLKPGLNIQLSLEATHMNLIQRNRPSGGAQRCHSSKKGQENLKILNWTYSLGVCHTDCVQAEIWEHCQCVLGMDTQFFRAAITENRTSAAEIFCKGALQRKCADDVITRSGSSANERGDQDNHLQICINSCAFPCDFWEYRTEMSSLDFPSRAWIKKDLEETRQTGRTSSFRRPSISDRNRRQVIAQHIDKFFENYNELIDEIGTDLRTSNKSNFRKSAGLWMTMIKHLRKFSQDPFQQLPDAGPAPAWVKKNLIKTQEYFYQNDATKSLIFEKGRELATDIVDISTAKKTRNDEQVIEEFAAGSQAKDWRENYIVLDVAFSSLQYTEVTQSPSMTFDTFISNIGGQVGLWIGASIVTLCKFFVILWPICLTKAKSFFPSNGLMERETNTNNN